MFDRRKRKSLSIFRPALSPLSPIHDGDSNATAYTDLKRTSRTPSVLGSASTLSPSSPVLERTSSLKSNGRSSPILMSRSRNLQKSVRPSSIFGSFRSLHSLQDEDQSLVRTASSPLPFPDENTTFLDGANMVVLHHGEVQTSGGMFRKKSQYLVLTNTHLLRFKTQAKASEVFSSIPSSLGRSSTIRHSRLSSGASSIQEVQLPVDNYIGVHLGQVVAVYKLEDGRPYFTIEIAHLDEASNQPYTMALQLNDPRESDLWLTSIRAAIMKSRLTDPMPFTRGTIESVVRAVEYECDYDPNHFHMFKVVQRLSKSGGRSSSDDLTKLTSNIFYLVIGIHRIHLITLPKNSKPASSTSLSDTNGASYGIASLTSICIQTVDDAFQLAFRVPLRQASTLYLASSCVNDVALYVRQAAEFLRPTWLEQPFVWNVPRGLDDAQLPLPACKEEDHQAFDRTLTAYCIAYDLDPSIIRYAVDYSCEDAPEFELLEPGNPLRLDYSILELLAVFRALRYNESFHSISLRNVRLDCLHGIYDPFGSEHMMWSTRSGDPVNLPLQDQSCLMLQEIQSLALKSKRLRRLDFSNCLTRKPVDDDLVRDPGSGIGEGLFPLCTQQLTNVDWIILSGIILAEIDVDYLYAAAIEKSCHFRALDLGHCGLTDESLKIVMQGIVYQEDTLESLNISGNLARLDSELLGRQLGRFERIRKLDLSNSHFCSGSAPLLACETLHHWRLEELSLAGTALNEQSIDALAAYLASEQSNTLCVLRLDQCQLTGNDVRILLKFMCYGRIQPRDLHLFISENRLEQQHSKLVNALKKSETPTHMTMQMLEYTNEQNFQSLLSAISGNASLKYLDISRVSLPFDASEETCKQMQQMLETNKTLLELNISGEQSHLETVTLGTGLSDALHGLIRNKCLQILRVEHQVLGLPGADALASVLLENEALREIYCEDNEINLQGFTTLTNAMGSNTTLLRFPDMYKDRAWSRQRIDREVENFRSSSMSNVSSSAKATVGRALRDVVGAGRSSAGRNTEKQQAQLGYTEQDLKAAVASLDDRWETEVARLHFYLRRNYCLAHGLPLPDDGNSADLISGNGRPVTANSLDAAMRIAHLDQTPTARRYANADNYGLRAEKEGKLGGRLLSFSGNSMTDGFLVDFGREVDEGEDGDGDGDDMDDEGSLMMAQEVRG